METITYPGPEGFSISVEYGIRIDKEFKINKILIEKELPESEHTFVLKSLGSSKGTTISMYLNTECDYSIFTQKIGETNEVYINGIEKTKNEFDQHVLRFRSYKISNPRISALYTNIIFNPVYTNQIKSMDCAFVRAPLAAPPPSVNISKIIPSIQQILKESPSLTVRVIADNKIRISNPEYTLLADIKDNKFTYFMPHIFTGRLTDIQEKEIGKLLVGGRRKLKRKSTKKRRRTNRV
jgi:hypothetical protein